jgi:leader peptidase (prepilin peptidase)/N-methyltransferase
MMLAAPPLFWGLLLASVAGLIAGAFVNWAAYTLAWNQRPISPWAAAHPAAPRRRASDRLPLWGWIGLRREREIHGTGFWVRPAAVELVMAAAWAALYWWEVDQQGLVAKQFEALAGEPLARRALAVPEWTTLATFASHALLLSFMAAATLVDIDEKTIPDGITIPGTVLALLLAAILPMSLLPHVTWRSAPPAVGMPIALPVGANLNGQELYLEPLTLAAPNEWPAELNGAPRWLSLAIGSACFATWLFALTPRLFRGRRGVAYGMRVLVARVVRELLRPPLLWIGAAGVLGIVVAWYRGGAAWVGLLTVLVGMIGGGALVWAVRIVGSAALRKEAMGFGDVTLMMMIGAFLGWQPCIFIFFIAPFAALVVGVLQLILRRDDVIPYGPFLCLGALIVMTRWTDLWNDEPDGFQAFFFFGWLVPTVLAIGIVMLGAMLVIWRNIKEALFANPN